MQFNYFGLKKLIATGYTQSDGSLTNQLELFKQDNKSYYMEIDSVSQKLSDTFTDNANNSLSNYDLLKMLKKEKFIKELKGDGDFRSNECIELLKQADIIVTNPPFSLFREYVDQLMKYDKKFLIIGNKNAITYKEVFRYIKENKIWLGYNSVKTFVNNKNELQHFGNVGWFTNLPVSKRNEDLILYKRYYKTEEDKNNPNYTNPDYPKYDNYDAIEVSKVVDIPIDYDGVMGVPITFLDKYTPKQFEIIKFRKGDDDKDLVYTEKTKDKNSVYDEKEKINEGKIIERERNATTYKRVQPYFRILIRCRGNR